MKNILLLLLTFIPAFAVVVDPALGIDRRNRTAP